MTGVEYWNSLPKPSEEVNVQAEDNDLVCQYGGIVYLLQRKGGVNNVVCFRREASDMTLYKSLLLFRQHMIEHNVEVVRVQGNLRRYKFLQKIHPGEGYLALQDKKIQDKNVLYVRLCNERRDNRLQTGQN